MFAFLVKDIMLLLRDRSQLLILLAMPFLLIAILGFSLRGIFSGDLEALEMDVALVALDDEAQAVEQIQNEIESMDLQQAENMALKQAAESAKPQTLFISLLESESLNKLITLEKWIKHRRMKAWKKRRLMPSSLFRLDFLKRL
ncbi:hypothetical protein B481_1368 [Planococcus halocryophilus Or1]|uniref:hypothetical protein n=1 Tax=Planococcus halocryophilus TaxID=1215089 RepID=UPI0002B86BBE|nr:hypothetical protein [Planococcus halocryophilus]EMF46980.1 hypothetical protein B481_1368 [Planococcus halocryophilus Or1]